ncbi:hypothetical protein [Symmachiella dynata]|uniref:hypothetical protein n=1 Tax=Symmachiella dynata TaxID=2527995 RepID=UPI0030EEFDA4
MALKFTKHEVISIKNHPSLSESWLQDTIAEDASILGLGDLELIERERPQERSGRLDLLLTDGDSTRYEVELMLGQTDPSHIIRCIEYWDIERRRYPGYEHIAVLVAEDITSRFLNILSLMAGNIPIIAIQLNALCVGEHLLLDFVHVLNQTSLRRDDIEDGGNGQYDRAYWEGRVGPRIMTIPDGMLEILNGVIPNGVELRYRKYHVTLSESGNWRNVAALSPRKQFAHLRVRVSDAESWIASIEEAGLPVTKRRQNRLSVTLKPEHVGEHRDLLRKLLHDAAGQEGDDL